MNLATIIALVPIVIGGATGGYATLNWALVLEEQVVMNTTQRQQDTWFSLDRRKKRGHALSKDEWIKWCVWGKRYEFIETCGKPPRGTPRQPRRR